MVISSTFLPRYPKEALMRVTLFHFLLSTGNRYLHLFHMWSDTFDNVTWLTSDFKWELWDLPARSSGHPAEVQARVFGPDSGHMKSDPSCSESVSVALNPSWELLVLRLVNAVVQVVKHLQPQHGHTVDLQRGDGDVGFRREAPLCCDVVVLLRLIDWTWVTRLEHSWEEEKQNRD